MSTTKRIAVTGATGRLGSQLVDVLEERGHDVVKVSRTYGVDLVTGEGLAEALDGVEVIIDAASNPSNDAAESTAFFSASTENLHAAGSAAGVQRMIVMSIIGIDQFTQDYSAGVNVHEAAAKAGPIPTDIVRASQFHEFVAQLVEWGTQGDVAYIWKMQTQPVAARALAEAVADLVDQPSEGGQLFEIAGPQAEQLVDLAGLLIEHEGRSLEVSAVSDPTEGHLRESGANLPGPDARLVGPTYADWLAARD